MKINLSKITNKKVYLLITVICFLIYGNSINNEYSLDDDMVADGILVSHGVKAIPQIFKSRYAVGKQEYEYRPIVTSSFAIEKQLFGKLPASQTKQEKEKNDLLTQANISHFINLMLYILTCILLYSLLQNIFKEYNVLLPMFVTILFLIHPLHTEPVANIKSRDELFVLLGIIISLKLYLRYIVTNQLKYVGFAMIAVLFAILSKKNALATLGLVPVVLYFVKADYKKILISTFSVVLIVLIFVLMKKGLLTGKATREMLFFENPLVYQGDFLDRILVGLYSSWFYLEILIYPVNLSFYYGYNQIPIADFSYWQVWTAIIFFIPLGIYGFIQFLKRKVIGLGIVIWFGVMLGVINVLFPIVGIVADRFTYIFSIGFCIVAGFLLLKIFKVDINSDTVGVKLPATFLLVFSVISIAYSARTIARNPDWHDKLTLYENDIEHLTESAKAHALIANTLYPKLANELRNNPNNPQIPTDIKKIIYHYNEALRIDSTYLTSINNLGSVYVNFLQDYEKAINYCSIAVAMDSSYVEARTNLAFSYNKLGKHDLALSHYAKVIELTPENLATFEKFMNIARDANKAEYAIQLLEKLKEKIPESKVYFISLANLYSLIPNGNQFTIYYFEKAFQLDSSDKKLCAHIHSLLVNSGNLERAQQYFEVCK
ncbi:MAG: tetratricopeptide repeat protein [Flavobacteriales bacterium]|nr:tetratricopeptide repeat protein [Flavobacteriales bacterium]